jgi:hypothetical protein
MSAVRWLRTELASQRYPALRGCLADRGKPDLIELAQANDEASNGSSRNLEYPEPDRLLAQGFAGVTLPPGYFDDLNNPDSDMAIIAACGEQVGETEAVQRMNDLENSVSSDWHDVWTEVSLSEELQAFYTAFSECLLDEAVPAEFANGNPMSFFTWVDSRAVIDDSHSLDDARLYVKCGQPLFDRREELLTARRDEFVESHRDQLQEMTDLIAELGIS